MEFRLAKNRIQALQEHTVFLLLLCVGLLVSNIILGGLVGFVVLHQPRTVTPMRLSQAFTVSDYSVDASYLRQMTLFFVNERLNVTPNGVIKNHALLLQYTDPRFRVGFAKQLRKEAEVIRTKKIRSVFYVESVTPDPRALEAVVTGTLQRWVGSMELAPAHKTYRIRYRYRLGRLRIVQFSVLGERHV